MEKEGKDGMSKQGSGRVAQLSRNQPFLFGSAQGVSRFFSRPLQGTSYPLVGGLDWWFGI